LSSLIKKPTWLYKPINNVPNLDKIQKEFYQLYLAAYNDVFTDVGWAITGIDINLVKKLAPNYINFLKKLDLYDILIGTIFSGSIGVPKETCPVHVDCEDWRQLPYSLNIPIIGCEDSYTVFYEVDESTSSKNGLPSYWNNDYFKIKGTIGYPEESVKEIGRQSANQTAFVNISIPHRPMTNHTGLRLAMLSRFTPDIFDYVNNDIFKTKLAELS
jgi:hypothetical protein